jgi:D-3-phosphoglycerate dehydrogenase
MAKVLISDKLSESAVDIFKKNKIEASYQPGINKEEILKIINEYDGLAIRSATKVTSDILEKGKNLKIVGRAGIGTDNVDKLAATKNGIIVMNTPFGNAVTTAEP